MEKEIYTSEIEEIFERINSGILEKSDIVRLLKLPPEKSDFLYEKARFIRDKYEGKEIHLRALIEFSNYCKRNCYYCGLRRGNKNLKRYRMSIDEIFETVELAVELGFKTVVLQSGEDPWFDAEKISKIIDKIKMNFNVVVTLSIGEREDWEYALWREAGAERYLLKHETSDSSLYRKLHPDPDMTLGKRIECLKILKKFGYQIGAGNMIGLPGQTLESIAEDIIFIKEIEADMAGIGPFIPHPDTPLSYVKKHGSSDLVLKTLAIIRVVMKTIFLPATTALATIELYGREKALLAGANVIMPNLTPLHYRINFEIYPNKRCLKEDIISCKKCIEKIVEGFGLKISEGFGHSKRKEVNYGTKFH
ncbi:MAG: [FeFe] hydrogenase H-cluster radical SAM maturase HydE [Candidatus Aminicenantia bacterium]